MDFDSRKKLEKSDEKTHYKMSTAFTHGAETHHTLDLSNAVVLSLSSLCIEWLEEYFAP